jgi:hypothetical protein
MEFDLSSCSIISCLQLDDSSLFARALASSLMSVVMCLRWPWWWPLVPLYWFCVILFGIWFLCAWRALSAGWPRRLPVWCCLWLVVLGASSEWELVWIANCKLCMRCASASSNGGLLGVLLYVSCSLSSLRFSIVQMRVPSVLCSVVCDGFVGCWVSSYLLVGCIFRS